MHLSDNAKAVIALTTRLGELTPPVIFGVGPPSLLDERGIGIVGSREAAD